MNKLGTKNNPLLVAIVGSGPSGFYAAASLFKSDINVKVDMIEKLPSPYGLVRSGVAPDHQKLKQAIRLYEKIADNPNFNLIANVKVGEDITVEELKKGYHAIIFAYGAETDRKLNIKGESLEGSYTATEFIAWYNGHPDYQNCSFDLSHEVAVIVGQGNVAIDVARILSKTVDELKSTDITQNALDALAKSNIREIHIVGRRGPVQAKFTSKELKEFNILTDCDPIVYKQDLALNPNSKIELEDKNNIGSKKNYDLLCGFTKQEDKTIKSKKCIFRFLLSPLELRGKDKLHSVLFEKNHLNGEAFKQSVIGKGENLEIKTGILFRSIGYRGLPISGVPFDDKKGIIPNEKGRVYFNFEPQLQFYTAGWIKRGPSGVIGTNKTCSVETVNSILEDLEKLSNLNKKVDNNYIYSILKNKNIRPINFSQWKKVDAKEIEKGMAIGKPREKITSVEDMLKVIDK